MEKKPEEKVQGTVEDSDARKPYEKPLMEDYQPLEEAGQVVIYYYNVVL